MRTLYKTKDLLKELDDINLSHADHSSGLCRTVISAAFASAWGFLIERKTSLKIDILLYVTMISCAIYIWYEAKYSEYIARLARKLHKKIEENKISERAAVELMNSESDDLFDLLKMKIAFTLIVVICLALYVLLKYVSL